MILVTGATGNLGKETIDFLLKKGVPASNIAAMVRDEAKAKDLISKGISIRKGDYNDPASMLAAFSGIEKLLLVSSTDIANRQQQQENAVRAAQQAGVKHIVYTSFSRKNETNSPLGLLAASHIATDKAIKESGIAYTILLNSLYADVLPLFLGEKVLETGIFFPAGAGKTAFTLRSDMAEATAVVLSEKGHENKSYLLASTVNVSFAELAEKMTKISGKAVAYHNPSPEIYTETLTKAGVPDMYVAMFNNFAQAIQQGEFEWTTSDLSALLGREATALEVYLQQVYGA